MKTLSDQFLTIKKELEQTNYLYITDIQVKDDFEMLSFECGEVYGEVYYREFDQYVNFSIEPYSKEIDELLTGTISKALCSFPLVSFNELVPAYDNAIMFCKEWNKTEETPHILRLLNGIRMGEIENITDVKILTKKGMEYYQDRLDKMPGVYTGSLTEEETVFASTCSEYNLYYMIKTKIQELKEAGSGETIETFSDEAQEIRFALEYLCVLTNRFNTGVEASKNYSPVELTMDYEIWLSSWMTYLLSLSNDDIEFLESLASNGEDVYPYLSTINSNMYEDGIKHIFINPNVLY